MSHPYRSHDAALLLRREELKRRLDDVRTDERIIRDQLVAIDRRLDINRELDDLQARHREVLDRQLKKIQSDERNVRAQLGHIDTRLGVCLPTNYGRLWKIGLAVLVCGSASLLAASEYIRRVREDDRIQAIWTLDAIGRSSANHFEKTGEPCPSAPRLPPEGVSASQRDAFAAWECLGVDVTKRRNFTYHYNADGNYVGSRDGQELAFEAIVEGDFYGDGEVRLLGQVGVIKREGFLVRGEIIGISVGE